MKDLEWKDEYLLGIPAIDLQHRRIFDFFVTIAEGSSKHERLRAEVAIVDLLGLLQQHSSLEESMMQTLCYPELEQHIKEHREFHATVHNLAQKALRTKESVSRETIELAQKWLQEHVMTSDRHYVEFFSNPVKRSVDEKRDRS